MKYLISILLLVGLCSCSPTKKINKLLTRYPGLIKADTTIDTLEVITERRIADTVLSLREIVNNYNHDTLIIREPGITTKIFIRDSILFTSTECEPETIRVSYPKIVNLRPDMDLENKLFEKDKGTWVIFLVVIVGIIITYFITRNSWRKKSN